MYERSHSGQSKKLLEIKTSRSLSGQSLASDVERHNNSKHSIKSHLLFQPKQRKANAFEINEPGKLGHGNFRSKSQSDEDTCKSRTNRRDSFTRTQNGISYGERIESVTSTVKSSTPTSSLSYDNTATISEATVIEEPFDNVDTNQTVYSHACALQGIGAWANGYAQVLYSVGDVMGTTSTEMGNSFILGSSNFMAENGGMGTIWSFQDANLVLTR